MKTHVTVDEFITNGGELIEGRQIWRDGRNNILEDIGVFKSHDGEFVDTYMGTTTIKTHIVKAWVQIEVTPIWA